MDYDVVARALTPPPIGQHARAQVERTSAPEARIDRPRPPAPTAPPRRVELSFHEDLHVLMTRVVDDQTGDLVREYPVRQVLDIVADVIARIRAREAARA